MIKWIKKVFGIAELIDESQISYKLLIYRENEHEKNL